MQSLFFHTRLPYSPGSFAKTMYRNLSSYAVSACQPGTKFLKRGTIGSSTCFLHSYRRFILSKRAVSTYCHRRSDLEKLVHSSSLNGSQDHEDSEESEDRSYKHL